MKNFLIFCAVLLGMLYLFGSGEKQVSQPGTSPNLDGLAQQSVSNNDGRSRDSGKSTSTMLEDRALPDHLMDFTCQLKQSDARSSLIAKLGQPTQDTSAGPTLLRWQHPDWGVDAMLDDKGNMKLVTARGGSLMGLTGDSAAQPIDVTKLQADTYTLHQIEALFGPGVLTKVSWEAGIPIADSILKNNPAMTDMTSDHCEHLYTWLLPGRIRPLTLAFRNGKLVESMIAGLSS